MQKLLWVFLPFALSACLSVEQKRYVEPTTGPSATVIFKNTTPGYAKFYFYDKAEDCSGTSELRSIAQTGEERTAKLVAGRDQAMSFSATVGNEKDCQVYYSIPVVADTVYEISMVMDPVNMQCMVEGKRSKAGGPKESFDVQHRKFTPPWSRESAHCKPLGNPNNPAPTRVQVKEIKPTVIMLGEVSKWGADSYEVDNRPAENYSSTGTNAGASAALRVNRAMDAIRGRPRAYRATLVADDGREIQFPHPELAGMRENTLKVGECYELRYSKIYGNDMNLQPVACAGGK